MRRRYFGGAARAWTNWADTADWCNSEGTTWAYDCSGTYSVYYHQQVRYFQFPNGTGRTATEYRATSVVDTNEYPGQCGYLPPRTAIPFYGWCTRIGSAYEDAERCFNSGVTGTIWQGYPSYNYYTSEFEAEMATAGRYMTNQPATWGQAIIITV